jgi:hypothetical protein
MWWATTIAWIADGGWSTCRLGWITKAPRANERRLTHIFGVAYPASVSPTRRSGSPGLLALTHQVTFGTSLSRSSRPSIHQAVPRGGRGPLFRNQSWLGWVFGAPLAGVKAMIDGRA